MNKWSNSFHKFKFEKIKKEMAMTISDKETYFTDREKWNFMYRILKVKKKKLRTANSWPNDEVISEEMWQFYFKN